jgi:hypothetical protein
MTEDKKQTAIKLCICGSCPTYKECGEKKAYCFVGKSKCIKEQKGCICGGCPVHSKFGLKNYYYCTKGTEENQK